MKKIIFQILIILLITTGCGFKVYNQSDLIKFSIEEIRTTGDKRINYNLKNKINSLLNNDYKKKIILIIETKKNKTVKEKNIKNEITKYQILINVNIKIESTDFNIEPFIVQEKGDYNISSQHSQSINVEKKLIRQLSNNLGDKILEELLFRLDDI
jgi:outer membrane lipopolysaccharide assembly protein LptE/RlpB